MAEESIETIELHTEFEKLREQVIRDECCPDWKVAKTFEHTTIYKGTIDHSHHVVYKVSHLLEIVSTINFKIAHLLHVMMSPLAPTGTLHFPNHYTKPVLAI